MTTGSDSELAKTLADVVRRQAELTQDVAHLKAEKAAEAKKAEHYRQLYLEGLAKIARLERGLIGQKSERTPPAEEQMSLGILGMMLEEREEAELEGLEAEEEEAPPKKRTKPTGRKRLPEELPRVEIEVIPDEVQRAGLDAFERIGEEVTEIIERRPGSLVVARVVKPKFVRKDRDTKGPTDVLVGSTPALPIERGLAGPGMHAHSIVARWQDHLPLHRLEQVYGRDGLPLARSTLCGWHEKLAELVEPVVSAMREDAYEAPYLCTDATGVLVQAKEKCRRGHFWVVIAPEKHVLFEYTSDHTKSAIDRVLSGYEGYLVADAHAVYDHLYERGDLKEVNCWAHARRYFFKAMSSEPERAMKGLKMINMLFRVERYIADTPRRKRERIRKERSAPVVERFFSWCDSVWPDLIEDTPLYAGVRYARNQREGLVRFLADGRLPLDNSISERELRRQAVGRKNWLFVGSDDGARVNATFTSLLASCRMHGVEPWAYLRDLFCLIPLWPEHERLALAPAYWRQTLEREDAKSILDANPYRALTSAPA